MTEFVELNATADATLTVVSGDAASASEVRAWARANGLPVGVRGRVSAEVKHQFTEATGRATQ